VGHFAIRPGPMMAAADRFTITIEGKGGHAARPFECIDPIVVASHVITALQSIVSRNVDPLDAGGQFCDKGEQYTAAVFVATPGERALAEASKRREAGRLAPAGLAPAGRPVATRVLAAAPFYAAEAYHQGYAKKNPVRYRFYRTSCRRDARLRELRELRGGA